MLEDGEVTVRTETRTAARSQCMRCLSKRSTSVLVSRRVLLKHAYATIIIGPKTGWNFASTTMSLAASQHRHHGARTCIVKATRVESEPQVEHPPSDLSAGKDDVCPRLSSSLVVTHPAVYLGHVTSADGFALGRTRSLTLLRSCSDYQCKCRQLDT